MLQTKSKPTKSSEVAGRIDEYINHKGMNRSRFAEKVGISAAQLFYMISKGKNFGIDKLLTIIECFPELNPNWLLKGEYPMEFAQTNGHSPSIKTISHPDGIQMEQEGVPLFNVEASIEPDTMFNDRKNIEGHISVPGIKGCDAALRVFGESMIPILRPGDIVMVNETNDMNQINWGDTHFVVTEELQTLKRLKPGTKDDVISMVSENPEYAPIELSIDKVKRLFHVKVLIRSLAL